MAIALYFDTDTQRTGPILVCDVCGERMADAKEVNVLWDAPTVEATSPSPKFYTTHKGRCTEVFDQRAGVRHAWSETSLFFFRLLSNIGVSTEDLERAAHSDEMLEGL